MKVVIATVNVPFVRGGAEFLAESLQRQLELRGHRAAIVSVPFKWYPIQSLLKSMLACRLMYLKAGEPDLVIALKFPAYLAPWESKRVWLLHQFRQAYELWDTPWQDLPSTPEGRAARDIVVQADNHYLRQAQGIFTISGIVADRLWTYNGIRAQKVLFPPLNEPQLFHRGEARDYFFFPSRLVPSKRQTLAIEAMAHVRGDFRLLLAGSPDTPAYRAELETLAARLGVENRVAFLGRVSEQAKADLMSEAVGVTYLPFDEDYGYVTLEAFSSHKPVIACSDGGGVLEFVEHGRNGLICDAEPQRLAEAMDALWFDRNRARALGEAGFETLREKEISWDHVTERLTS